MKEIVKRMLLRKRGIYCDKKSQVNFDVRTEIGFRQAIIRDSHVHLVSMGDGCFIEHAYAYGDIELGRFVSISGPGTILHSEGGLISIGNFTSIAANVSIQQFNHNMRRSTTFAVHYSIFNEDFVCDTVSKGNVTIEEDVWIGSNAVICSGVHIGRGAVIGAGAVVTADVSPYSIYGGVPAREIKKRFTDREIQYLESTKWWLWDRDKIKENRYFFDEEVGCLAEKYY